MKLNVKPEKPEMLKDWLSGQIRRKVSRGEYRPGSILQSERALSETYGVSRITVRAALDILAEEGLLQRHPRRGVIVTKKQTSQKSTEENFARPDRLLFIRLNPSPLVSVMADGIDRYCRETGIECLFVDADSHQMVLRYLNNPPHGIRGIIFVPFDTPEYNQAVREALEKGISIVCLERALKESGASSVEADSFSGGYRATCHLLERRHTPVYCIGYAQPAGSVLQREEGWKQAMAIHGFTHWQDYRLEINMSEDMLSSVSYEKFFEYGSQAAAALFENRPIDSDGWSIYSCSDLFVPGIYLAAEKRRLKIGQDVRIVGTGDYPFARRMTPPLSSIDFPHQAIGYKAAKMLHEELTEPGILIHQVLPTKLIERESSLGKPS